MKTLLEMFVWNALCESEDIERDENKLLTEPDYSPDEDDDPKLGKKSSEDKKKKEQSMVGGGAIAGVTTPLGTGPTYPDKGKKSKSAWEVSARAYGKAKLASKKK